MSVYTRSNYFAYIRFLRKEGNVYEFRVLNVCFIHNFSPKNEKDFNPRHEVYARYFRDDELDHYDAEFDHTAYYSAQVLFMADNEAKVNTYAEKQRSEEKRVHIPKILVFAIEPQASNPAGKDVSTMIDNDEGENSDDTEEDENKAESVLSNVTKNNRKEQKKAEDKSKKTAIANVLSDLKKKQNSEAPADQFPMKTYAQNTAQHDSVQQYTKLKEKCAALQAERDELLNKHKILVDGKKYYKERCLKFEAKVETLEKQLDEERKLNKQWQEKVMMFLSDKSDKKKDPVPADDRVKEKEPIPKRRRLQNVESSPEPEDVDMTIGDEKTDDGEKEKSDDIETPVINLATEKDVQQDMAQIVEKPYRDEELLSSSDDDVDQPNPRSSKKKLAKLKKFQISKKMDWVVTSDDDEDDPNEYPDLLISRKDSSGDNLEMHVGKGVWIPKSVWDCAKKLPENRDSTWTREICIGMLGGSILNYSFLGKKSKFGQTKPQLPTNERRALKRLYKQRLLKFNPSLKGSRLLYMNMKKLSANFGSMCSDKNKKNKKSNAVPQQSDK